MNAACSFCTSPENKEREIMRTDLVLAFPTRSPIVPGHTLICPVRCVSTFEELTREEVAALFDAMGKIKSALRKSFGAKGFNHAWNEDKIAGQSVPHFHLHVLPRAEEDEVKYGYEPRQFLYRSAAHRDISSDEELKEVADVVRQNL